MAGTDDTNRLNDDDPDLMEDMTTEQKEELNRDLGKVDDADSV